MAKKWDSVFFHSHERDFKTLGLPRLFPSWKLIFVVNAPTSRVSVCLKYLSNFDDAIKEANTKRWVVAVPVQLLVYV